MFWRAPLLHQRQKCQVKLAYTVAVFIMPPLVLPKLFFLSPSACVRSANNSNFRSFPPFFFHLAQPKGSLQPRLVLGPGQLNYSILSDLSIQCVPFVYWIYRSVGWTHARSSFPKKDFPNFFLLLTQQISNKRREVDLSPVFYWLTAPAWK